MFCDAIFSHLRYIYEVKQFIELKNTQIYKEVDKENSYVTYF